MRLYLFEHFVVCGLPSSGLVTLGGEKGYVGADVAYRPCCIDSVSQQEAKDQQPPPQTPLCCMPEGVRPVHRSMLQPRDLLPCAYPIVLTEGDGTKVYVSCLLFYDELPTELLVAQPELLGYVAPKTLCLVTHQPYLNVARQVLQQLYTLIFCWGLEVSLGQAVGQLLQVPAPVPGGPPVAIQLGPAVIWVPPPLTSSKEVPPPGECCLAPLLEALAPDQLVALFMAVLLERRVLLRAKQLWQLTSTAEAVVRLLYPFRCPPTYIPVVPSTWTEFLEAPTMFLMGFSSAQYLDPRLLDGLVVVDLDNGRVDLGEDAPLAAALEHPYVVDLRARLRAVLRPTCCMGELVGDASDAWVAAGLQLPCHPVSGPVRETLVGRIFMEFFRDMLYGLLRCCTQGRLMSAISLANEGPLTPRMLRITSRSTSSSANLWSAISMDAPGNPLGGKSGVNVQVDGPKWVAYQAERKGVGPELHEQLLQTVGLLHFAAQQWGQRDAEAWYREGLDALQERQAAEEQLLRSAVQQPATGPHIIAMPQALQLLPQPPLVYSSCPSLKTWPEASGPGHGGSSSSMAVVGKRRSTVAKHKGAPRRRALSELSGSPLDRVQPVVGAVDDTMVHLNALDTEPTAAATGAGPLPRPGSALPNSSPGMASGLTTAADYLQEAELLRQQSAALLQLLTAPAGPCALARLLLLQQQQSRPAGKGGGVNISSCCPNLVSNWLLPLTPEKEAARQLLAVQTGGNGWFLLSKIQEMLNNPSAALVAAAAAAASAACVAAASAGSAARGAARGLPAWQQLQGQSEQQDELTGPVASSRSMIVSGSRAVSRALAASGLAAMNKGSGKKQAVGGKHQQQQQQLARGSPEPSDVSRSAKSAAAALGLSASMPARSPNGSTIDLEAAADAAAGKGSTVDAWPSRTSKPQRASDGCVPELNQGELSLPASVVVALAAAMAPLHNSSSSSSSGALGGGCGVQGGNGNASGQRLLHHFERRCQSLGLSNRVKQRAAARPYSDGHAVIAAPAKLAGPERQAGLVASGPTRLAEASSATPDAAAAGLPLTLPPSRFDWPGSTDCSRAAQPSDSKSPSGTPPGSSAGISSSPQHLQQPSSSSTPAAPGPAPDRVCRLVSCDSWRVLADMMRRVLFAAAILEEWQQVVSVLSLSAQITCRPVGSGPEVPLLCGLSSQPLVFKPWFWSSAFAAAVTNASSAADARAMQQDQQQQAQREQQAQEPEQAAQKLLLGCATDFVVYMAGVGLSGCAAWRMLAQLLQQAHESGQHALSVAARVQLRAQLAQLCRLSAAARAAAGMSNSNSLLSATGSCVAKACQLVQTPSNPAKGSSSSSGAAAEHGRQASLQLCTPFQLSLQDQQRQRRPGGRFPCRTAATPLAREPVLSKAPFAAAQKARAAMAAVAAAASGAGGEGEPAASSAQGAKGQPPSVATPEAHTAAAAAGAAAPAGRLGRSSSPDMAAGGGVGGRPGSPSSKQPLGASPGRGKAASRPPSGCQKGAAGRSPERSGSPSRHSVTPAAGVAVLGGPGGASDMAADPGFWLVPPTGSSLQHPGAVQWGQLHGAPVAALAAANFVTVTAAYDGFIKVLDAREGQLQLYAAMPAPQLSSCWQARNQHLQQQLQAPVVVLCGDASRALVGNAGGSKSSLWMLDIQGGAAAVELQSGPVTAVQLLDQDPHTLLAAMANPTSSTSTVPHPQPHNSNASSACCHAVSVWDTRQPAAPGLLLECRASPAPVHTLRRSVSTSGHSSNSKAVALASTSSSRSFWRSDSRSSSPLGFLSSLLSSRKGVQQPGAAAGAAAAAAADAPSGVSGGVAAGVLPGAGLTSLAAAEAEGLVAAGTKDGSIFIWDVRQGATPLAWCHGHQGPVQHLTFTNGTTTTTTSSSNTSSSDGSMPQSGDPGTMATIRSSSSSTRRSGSLLVSGSDDWTVRTWDAHSGASRGACVGLGGRVTSLAVVNRFDQSATAGSSSSMVMAGAADGSVGLWQMGGELMWLEQGHAAAVLAVAPGSTPGSLTTGAADLSGAVWACVSNSTSSGSSSSSTQQCSSSEQAAGGCSAAAGAAATYNGLVGWRLTHQQAYRALATCSAADVSGQLLVSGLRDGNVVCWNYGGLR